MKLAIRQVAARYALTHAPVASSSLLDAINRHPNREHFVVGFVVGVLLVWMLRLLWKSGARR